MPSFNGTNIFGAQVKMKTDGMQREIQTNSYMAIDGTEMIDGGFREFTTSVKGRLFGLGSAGGESDLQAAIIQFRNYQNGNSYVLVDNYGSAWNNVMLESFELDDDGVRVTSIGDYFQLYTAVFKHLSSS